MSHEEDEIQSRFHSAGSIAVGVATWLADERIETPTGRDWLLEMPVLNARVILDFQNAAYSYVEALENRILKLEAQRDQV